LIQFEHDAEAEAALLGAIMAEQNLIWTTMQSLKVEDFYKQEHRDVYGAMVDIAENGDGKIDIISLSRILRYRKVPNHATLLSSFDDALPDVGNASHYAKIIKECSLGRKLTATATKITLQQGDPRDRLNLALDDLIQLVSGGGGADSWTLPEAVKIYRENQNSGATAKVFDCGMSALDSIVTFRKENMIVVAGHPGTGKSSLALQIAMNVMKQGRVLFVSMEMGRDELVERAVQLKTGCSASVIDNPTYQAEGIREKIEIAFNELQQGESTLEVFVPNRCTPQDVLGKAMEIKARFGDLSLVIIDYLQRVHWPVPGLGAVQETTEKSRAMKDMARAAGVPVMVLSQLSRNSAREGKEPQLHDLRDSGAIEQDADIAIFTHRPNEDTNDAVLLVRKQRHGPTGSVKCEFDRARCRFIERVRGY